MKLRSGTSKCGTNPILTSGSASPSSLPTLNFTTTAAAAVKRVNPRFRVGGPATAQAAWPYAFIQHCVDKHIPVDFVSTHVYGNDGAQDVFGTNENIPRDRMVCRSVKKVHDQIRASALPPPSVDLERIQRQLQERAGNH